MPLVTLGVSAGQFENGYTSKRLGPYWSNPPFLIFDIRALRRSVLSAGVPECRKIKNGGLDQYGPMNAFIFAAVRNKMSERKGQLC